jgi:hypothetical protein
MPESVVSIIFFFLGKHISIIDATMLVTLHESVVDAGAQPRIFHNLLF